MVDQQTTRESDCFSWFRIRRFFYKKIIYFYTVFCKELLAGKNIETNNLRKRRKNERRIKRADGNRLVRRRLLLPRWNNVVVRTRDQFLSRMGTRGSVTRFVATLENDYAASGTSTLNSYHAISLGSPPCSRLGENKGENPSIWHPPKKSSAALFRWFLCSRSRQNITEILCWRSAAGEKIWYFWRQNEFVCFEIAPQAKKIRYFAFEMRFL